MLAVLANRTYGRLFLAQIIALLGTGLLTVALGLLAFALAGDRAGTVLGTALAIKMIAYVAVAPVVGAFAAQLPRKGFLIAMDLVRAAIALLLPFVSEVWQIYVLIFLLQSASAAFTPTFQATIPDVLPDEADYTKALSLSRLAYDLESLISPMLAAALLTLISYHWLFSGTVAGFLVSAALILSVTLPASPAVARKGGIYDRTTRGMRIYLATPRLRGLLALNLAAAAGGAMVIVNTVVFVKGRLGLGDGARTGLLRWRLDGRSPRLAAPAGVAARPARHVRGRDLSRWRARGRGRAPVRERGKPRLDLVARPAGDLAAARPGLFRRSDAIGAAAASLGSYRRSTGRLRRAVRPVACLLACDLSAGRLARCYHAGRSDL